MNSYEKLLQKASDENVTVYESFDLNGDSDPAEHLTGLYIDGNIALDKKLSSTAEKISVLAEELGHHFTTHGNILNINNTRNRKQERFARLWGYNKLIGLTGIINAFKAGCQNRFEIAEFLGVTEEFLQDCLDCYKEKYGAYITIDNFMIFFIPNLAVMERIG